VGRRKTKSGKLSVFKGKEARLNRAIFQLLALESPQAKWDIFRQFRKRKDLAHVRYSVLIRRMQALQESDYLIKVGERRTRLGSETGLYQLTPRAELAIALDQTNLNKFIREADYHQIITMLNVLVRPKQQK